MKENLARILIVLGFLCIAYAFYLYYLRIAPNRLSFTSPPTQSSLHENTTLPTILSIPSLSMYLPVIPSTIENNNWQTTDRGVSYLLSSALPGNKGNSIFYGHNYESILGKLPHVKKGDLIEIKLQNGDKKVYTVSYTQTVTADSVYILDQTLDSRLTIYTCIGFFDSKRFVVVAVPATS